MTAPWSRRLWLAAGVLGISASPTGTASAASVTPAAPAGQEMPRLATDRIVLPPERRELRSPSGRFRLVIGTHDHWQTPLATGELTEGSGAAQRPVWRQSLPQTQGPRHVLVTDQGRVLMFDSWVNVASPHALVLLSPQGQVTAQYGFDDIVAKLGLSRRAVAQHSRMGAWLSSAPVLSDDGQSVRLAAGGQHLRLDLADGSLRLVD